MFTDRDSHFKKCSKCMERKKFDDFYNNKSQKDGKANYCKICHSKNAKEMRLLSIDRKHEEWKVYYQKNKEVISLRGKKHYAKKKDSISRRHSRWRIENKDKMSEYSKKHYTENREEKLRLNRLNEMKRLSSDPIFRLIKNMRNRNRAVLKGISKSKKSLEILGCDRGFLLKYIEDMFYGEMTWDNYGAYWHLDHKKPCSSFDFSIDGEIEKCFHYSNLQPLTAIDNLKKYNKCL